MGKSAPASASKPTAARRAAEDRAARHLSFKVAQMKREIQRETGNTQDATAVFLASIVQSLTEGALNGAATEQDGVLEGTASILACVAATPVYRELLGPVLPLGRPAPGDDEIVAKRHATDAKRAAKAAGAAAASA